MSHLNNTTKKPMSAPKQQTAVEWLEKQFVKLETTIGVHGIMYELIEQAKAMEKEQMIDFHIECMKKGLEVDGSEWKELYLPKIKDIAEQYYKETYD